MSGWAHRAQSKAAEVWAGLARAKEGSWKLWVYRHGERLVDRLEYEELALRGVDPALGPPVPSSTSAAGSRKRIKIPLVYPPRHHAPPLSHLRAHIAARVPRHRRAMYAWLIAAPFTAPFMIIPVIPNLPFFFCAYRAWSHWRAHRGAVYVDALIDAGMVVPEPCKDLDRVYDRLAREKEDEKCDGKRGGEERERRLLSPEDVPRVLGACKLPVGTSMDVLRAVSQVYRSVR